MHMWMNSSKHCPSSSFLSLAHTAPLNQILFSELNKITTRPVSVRHSQYIQALTHSHLAVLLSKSCGLAFSPTHIANPSGTVFYEKPAQPVRPTCPVT